MHPQLTPYLTQKQYDSICKFWRLMNKCNSKLEDLYSCEMKTYEEFTDDEETIAECVEHNNRITRWREKFQSRLQYYETEYATYVNKIGYQFNDRSQPERLFCLLNMGI